MTERLPRARCIAHWKADLALVQDNIRANLGREHREHIVAAYEAEKAVIEATIEYLSTPAKGD